MRLINRAWSSSVQWFQELEDAGDRTVSVAHLIKALALVLTNALANLLSANAKVLFLLAGGLYRLDHPVFRLVKSRVMPEYHHLLIIRQTVITFDLKRHAGLVFFFALDFVHGTYFYHSHTNATSNNWSKQQTRK